MKNNLIYPIDRLFITLAIPTKLELGHKLDSEYKKIVDNFQLLKLLKKWFVYYYIEKINLL